MKQKIINATPGQVQKKEYGQFYTQQNIFDLEPFKEWFFAIPENKREVILEPFAGSNGLIIMLEKAGLLKKYKSYDIEPRDAKVLKRDTIKRFPDGYHTVITNPPFLAKNVATRKGLDYQLSEMDDFNDLYLKSLETCLKGVEYVAIIIPESFIVSPLFKDRLKTVVSLNIKNLFKDTEQPVCLALFNPDKQEDFSVYQNNEYIGEFQKIKHKTKKWLSKNVPEANSFKKDVENVYRDKNIIFHDKQGQIGIICIDATDKNKKMAFVDGSKIDEKDVGYHARLRTRIKIIPPDNITIDTQEFIDECNKVLNEYRKRTGDIFLNSFKGLRNDGKYRRRMDFISVRMIINKVYFNLWKENDK